MKERSRTTLNMALRLGAVAGILGVGYVLNRNNQPEPLPGTCQTGTLHALSLEEGDQHHLQLHIGDVRSISPNGDDSFDIEYENGFVRERNIDFGENIRPDGDEALILTNCGYDEDIQRQLVATHNDNPEDIAIEQHRAEDIFSEEERRRLPDACQETIYEVPPGMELQVGGVVLKPGIDGEMTKFNKNDPDFTLSNTWGPYDERHIDYDEGINYWASYCGDSDEGEMLIGVDQSTRDH